MTYDYRWAAPPVDPDTCRKRGHGRVRCEDCGEAWEAGRDDAADAKRDERWADQHEREVDWDEASGD
jgi:hypothetical protein